VWCDDPDVDQMGQARKVIERHPGVTLCVDHAGFPRRRDAAYFAEWRDGLREVAAAPNAVIKISGLGMADHRWTVASIRPWVLACIEVFGVDRAFDGTHWPLDRLYSSDGDVVEAYSEIISDFTAAEQRALFNGNADRIFRLPPASKGSDR
jgi:predicted TIM-barrel fold metal-dependent hydrolase